ncbi:MAG: glycerol-3-phosphate 1-O-acyltransferase PlsY [Phenylobacterium sp.]|uniref:glycerol-3-phosphate 1-O-acyltransferase PlsY n=1 Tax=Phenylobacterium sp. TaxID=1871053 RepID=UPI001A489421|nr:glycerol-3-phosphate 1-O-acyltransferase PlsY [Phenylobacterium sp.]MBL8773471.1 glycerol-3-phosphate 1-O-acyltransferase PlsY [Phenylobacterium sp.]
MMLWAAAGLAVAGAYLLGAIPSGYLAGRLLKGVDIRTLGSRSTGATNVLRTLGPWPALAVFAVDLAKGAAAVLLAGASTAPLPAGAGPWIVCLAGLAALLGHSRSIFLGFTGGKSAAAGLGVLLAMSWPVGLGAAGVFAAGVAISRVVSLSSMLAAVAAAALVLVLPHPAAYRLLVVAGAAFVIWLHRANIGRLLSGTEPRVSLGRR